MRVGGEALEAIDQVGGIGARAGQREVLAGAPVERRDRARRTRLESPSAFAVVCAPSARSSSASSSAHSSWYSCSKCSGVMQRRPSSHCATPSTRARHVRSRIGPSSPGHRRGERGQLVEPLGGQRRRARGQRDRPPPDRRGASGRAGASGGTSCERRPRGAGARLVHDQRRGGDVAEPLAVARASACRRSRSRSRTAGSRRRAAGCASPTRPA